MKKGFFVLPNYCGIMLPMLRLFPCAMIFMAPSRKTPVRIRPFLYDA